MAEGYTHIRTARQSAELAQITIAHPAVFAAGANGPDNLFAYQIWKPSAERRFDLPVLGNRLHRESCGAFLTALVEQAVTPIQKEYALGFLCHYATDCAVHPYVYAVQQGGMPYHCAGGHGLFEIALDCHLHREDTGSACIPVADNSPRLIGSERAEPVALLHDTLLSVYGADAPHECLSDAFEQMRLVRKYLSESRLGIKKRLLWLGERVLFGRAGYLTGHCTPAKLRGLSDGAHSRIHALTAAVEQSQAALDTAQQEQVEAERLAQEAEQTAKTAQAQALTRRQAVDMPQDGLDKKQAAAARKELLAAAKKAEHESAEAVRTAAEARKSLKAAQKAVLNAQKRADRALAAWGRERRAHPRLPAPWQNPFTGETVEGGIFEVLEKAAQAGAVYMVAAREYWEGKIDLHKFASLIGSRSYCTGTTTLQSAWDAENAPHTCYAHI